MRIAILNKKGIEKIVDETLEDLPVNQRFSRVNDQVDETIPSKVNVIPAYSSYCKDFGRKSRIIDLIGPYEDVPNFVVASNECERNEILKDQYLIQNQLIVLDNGVFFRHLALNGYRKEIKALNVEGVYLSNGYCLSDNKQKRQPKGNEVGFGQTRDYESGITYSSIIGSPRIWESLVESMTDYFLNYDFWTANSNKVIYGSERSRDKLVSVFEKVGLKPIK